MRLHLLNKVFGYSGEDQLRSSTDKQFQFLNDTKTLVESVEKKIKS